MESLPKNGRASLGDALYWSITDDVFDPEEFLESLDLSTEHKILDLKNRVEASTVAWVRKMHHKDGKCPWGSAVSLEKRKQFEERAEAILLILKHRFPGIPQSALDISKIQYKKDVGHSVLESYSRILKSLAFTVMSGIDDVLYADSVAQDPALRGIRKWPTLTDSEPVTGKVKVLDPQEEIGRLNQMEAPTSMTLSDFMGWQVEQDSDKKKEDSCNLEDTLSSEDGVLMKKPPNIVTNKKFCYIEKIETLGGLISPSARH